MAAAGGVGTSPLADESQPQSLSRFQSQKRASTATPSADIARRPKRGKYTAVACDECKRRKLKCLPSEDETQASCRRCTASRLTCIYPSHREAALAAKGKGGDNRAEIRVLESQMKKLRQDMAELSSTVQDLEKRVNINDAQGSRAPASKSSSSPLVKISGVQAGESNAPRPNVPKAPQFVGPTRSAYSIEIGQRSLTRMGIPSYDLPSPSAPQSPVERSSDVATSATDFWQRTNAAEVSRLLFVFQEEVESVYPVIDCTTLASYAQQILDYGRESQNEAFFSQGADALAFSLKDFQMAVIGVATALVIEAHEAFETSEAMVESVERTVSRISKPEVDIKGLQLFAILSIYYFHSDDDLLAWRTIGYAAREALEIGLHRKATMLEKFGDGPQRREAIRVFWCIYVLDRRWSFGTSLPFALHDRDIEPELPEPGPDHQYLQCMVGYGRLCSRLWDALMSFGAKSNFIPEETAAALDMKTQEWLESIPSDLQLRHPRLGLAARAQPRVLQRLRALLYLRGNHTRILIYRHHMLSPSRIKADMTSARLVVEIARDSIQVLIHLNTTSDIYSRQQSAFNYFLISALAIIFLAVCHDAATFAETCRPSFHAAVDLVRDFSRRSQASRRLWKSIRGLLPRLRKLTNGRLEEGREGEQNNSTQQETAGLTAANANPSVDDSLYREAPLSGLAFGHQANEQNASHVNMDSNTEVSGSTPNMFEVGNSLVELFDVFESAPQFPSDYSGQDYYGAMFPLDSMYGESGELSRRFQGLI